MIAGLETPQTVRAVVADGCTVFLDIARDRYFKLGRAQTLVLQGDQTPERTQLVDRLRVRGLIGEAKETARVTVRFDGALRTRSCDAMRVLGACRWADRSLKRRRFSDVIAWALAAPARAGASEPSVADIDRFRSRRLFYPRDYNCLFDSLALVRFLRLRGLAGDWVFGVRGMPFAAHCWVAIGNTPLNDDPDFVAPYTRLHVV